MTTAVAEREGRWTTADIENGLHLVAALGTCAAASRECGIPERTIQKWCAGPHRERLLELQRTTGEQLQAQAAANAERSLQRLQDAEDAAVERFQAEINNLAGKDAAAAAKNLSIAKGNNIDKILLLRGKPTAITEHRGPQELYRTLKAQGFAIDTTATDITSEDQHALASDGG